METIQNENKENFVHEMQKQSAMAVPQKRPLGQRNTNVDPQPVQLKEKQPLTVPSSFNAFKEQFERNKYKGTKNTNKENYCQKGNKNIVNPVIPCNQFKDFKVFEDEQYPEEKLKNLAAKNPPKVQVHEDIKEETKDEVKAPEKIVEKENIKQDSESLSLKTSDAHLFMTIDDNYKKDHEIPSTKRMKDIFFEMEEYRSDIYHYLREHELRNRPKPGYMKKQPDVSSNMRTILVDWLVEVAEEYKLHTETLYLAVNYIDRFLSYMSVVRAKLQLVGTAAMFIASKYEEIYPPEISEFVYITDDTYTKKQVLRMEQLILKVLSFDLSIPTPLTFITAMCVSNNLSDKTMYLAMYLSELALLNGDIYLEFLPSVIAAAAIALARHTLCEEAWPKELVQSTGYEGLQIRSGISFLYQMFVSAMTLPQHAIQDKYKTRKCMHVSTLKPRDVALEL
uniref:G2/mitotic-specific cyclin-A-like n=1 Tax=Diabrotica virgifera virgifera TaxID=50390 RepID=A0A6P7GC24_DIAVI